MIINRARDSMSMHLYILGSCICMPAYSKSDLIQICYMKKHTIEVQKCMLPIFVYFTTFI